MFDEIERLLFKPFAVSTLERVLINGACVVIGFAIGVEFL